MEQLRKTGADGLLKKELANGKLMIGESAGAIICAPSIQYIEQMDEKPEDYSQEDDAGLDLIDFYVLVKVQRLSAKTNLKIQVCRANKLFI